MYGWLTDGIDDAAGRTVMPGIDARIETTEVWNVIDYNRADNAGLRVLPQTGPDELERQISRWGLRRRTGSGVRHVHAG